MKKVKHKTQQVGFRVTDEERQKLNDILECKGITISKFMTDFINLEHSKIMAEKEENEFKKKFHLDGKW